MFNSQKNATTSAIDTETSLSEADLDSVTGGVVGLVILPAASTQHPVLTVGTGFSTFNPVSRGGTGFSTYNPVSTGYGFYGFTHR